MDNSGILDSSGFYGFSFGDVNKYYDQLVQIRSKDIGSNPLNGQNFINDGKSKNQILFSSENNTNNSQLLIGSACDNIDANNKSFIMATDTLYIGKSNPNDINVYDSSSNLIIDTSGIVKITGNNLLDTNAILLDISGNTKMKNIQCIQNISSNSSTVTGDISCGNFIYAKKLIVDSITDLQDVSLSTDLNINDISASTMKINDTFDISNMLSIEVSSNSIIFNNTNIDISSTSNSFHFNVYRPLNVIDNTLNISGGTLNINNGNMNISGSIIADDFEINSNLTAIYANIDDIDVSSIDINSTNINNADIATLDASNIFIKNSGILDTSAGICRFGDTSLNGTFDVNGTIKSTTSNFINSFVTGILDVSTDISSTHATIQDISINNKLDVSGNINCDTLNGKGIVPVGGIIIYNGLSVDIPNNWLISDGTNGTPDLSAQTVFAPLSNITYYVRENANATLEPYYIFSHTSGGTALNSSSNPLQLIIGNTYTFIASESLGNINSDGFNVGTAFKSNNPGYISITSTGTGINSTNADNSTYAALINQNEQLSFTIPRSYNSGLKYFNSSQTTNGNADRILSFILTDDYSIVYIKRNS